MYLYYNFINKVNPTLKCVDDNEITEDVASLSRYTVNQTTINNKKTNSDLIYPIALISADELVLAGAFRQLNNGTYHLADHNGQNFYFASWTMTPLMFRDGYARMIVNYAKTISIDYNASGIAIELGVRPVINIKSNILVNSGNGTKENPYTLKMTN